MHSVWQSTEALLYVLGKSDIILTQTHLRKTQFQMFYYKHIIEIPTNKGAHSYKLKLSKIGN